MSAGLNGLGLTNFDGPRAGLGLKINGPGLEYSARARALSLSLMVVDIPI